MRTFHRGDGAQVWTWAIDRDDSRLSLTFGKLGGRLRTQTVEHETADAARFDLAARVHQKLREGYLEQHHASALHRALEEAVVANPDDLAAHMAFADWLSEQPAPALRDRGEFMQVQLALEDGRRPPAERQRLRQREAELLALRRDEWLGDLSVLFGAASKDQVVFARGWAHALVIRELSVASAGVLAQARELRLLRRLVLLGAASEYFGPESPYIVNGYPALSVLWRAENLANVEALHLGDADGRWGHITYPHAGGLRDLIERLPRLRELCVNSRETDRQGLLGSPALRQLHTLRLDRARLGDEGVAALLQSGVLKNLKVLQLWKAQIADAGAKALAGCKDLGRLDLLDLSFNWIGAEGLDALRRTGVRLVAEYQMAPGDDLDEDLDLDDDDFDDDFDDDDLDDDDLDDDDFDDFDDEWE